MLLELISYQANILINSAIDDGTISDLRAVVLDELHMVDDDHRGYLMELIATKLLCLEQDVQIVGMSATLSVSTDIHCRTTISSAAGLTTNRTSKYWPNG